ncbi:MAG: cytochrome c [Rubrivivax sp.]|nr:cytochrome c [Rubrivivax sp.]MDH5338338.1 cytochrome c [Rubrivivax sp.]
MPRILVAAAVAVFGLTALPALAQFQKPEQAIKYRQSVFTVMATHFGRVAAMAQGKAPFDAQVAADNAMLANSMAALPYMAFGAGTDKGAPTRAKAEIWLEPDKFKASAQDMQKAMAKFADAAKGGSLDAIKATVDDVGKACKACHDDFRAEKYSSN